MKLPNGYGSVYKLPGNRRKPWAVRIVASRSESPDGTPHFKYKYLGYYETKEKALIALAQFNAHPYNTDANKVTFGDVFEMWSAEHFPKVSHSNVNGYNAVYNLCAPISSMRFNDIRKVHLQNIVDTCGKNYPTLRKLKILYSMMYKFALANDLCSKNYSQTVDISQYSDRNPDAIERKPFSKDEIEVLWSKVDASEYVAVVLMLIYSGCRISELLDLKKENVNLSERWFDITAAKTKAGIRKVPIAEKVMPLFRMWHQKNGCEYLISTHDGNHFEYRNFYDSYWQPVMELTEMQHKPHDTRHTCISMLAEAGVDERIIKRIVGHKGHGVTEAVYTHYDINQLLNAIDLI